MNKLSKGFTLIELLVVIAILAILAAIALTSYQSTQKSARDAQRKSDLNQYRVALENYALNNNGQYPAGSFNSNTNLGIFSDSTNMLIPSYLPAKILDPKEGSVGCVDTSYCLYWYRGITSSYALYASLENGVSDTTQAGTGVDTWTVCSDGRSGTMDCRWVGGFDTVCNQPNTTTPTCPLP